MVRPGSNYKLYKDFKDQNLIIADLLGLELTKGIQFKDQLDIVAQMHRARRIRSTINRDVEQASRNINDYNKYVKDRSIVQMLRIARGFFHDARKGDLVVVPPNSFSENALIGELLDEPEAFVTTKVARYGLESLYARRVKWLAEIQKGKLPTHLLDVISKPSAITLVRKDVRAPIYRAAYGSYVYGDEFRSRFDLEKISPSEDIYIQSFFKFITENYRISKDGGEALSFRDAAFARSNAYELDLQTNINSPGFFNLISQYASPILIAIFLEVCVAVGPSAAEEISAGNFSIGNTLDHDGECAIPIREEVQHLMNLIGDKRWTKACEDFKASQESTALRSQVEVEVVVGGEDGE